jgi:hypothetical protein
MQHRVLFVRELLQVVVVLLRGSNVLYISYNVLLFCRLPQQEMPQAHPPIVLLR